MMSLRNIFLASVAGGVFFLPSAQAQEQAASINPDTGLSEIVVTAQFRSENLQSAAIPVDVVSNDHLQRAGVVSAAQLTNVVPSLQIANGGAGTQAFYLRGVGNTTPTSLVDPGVAFNVDGVYIGRPTSVANTFFDLERIEVLKGPQGTLYGRNSTGGAINVIPAKPRIGETSGFVSGTVGNYDTAAAEAAINLGLTDIAAARFAVTFNRHDAYLSDGTSNAKDLAARGQLLVKPTDDLSFRISADYAHVGGNGPGSIIAGYLGSFTGQSVVRPLPRNIGYLDPRSDAIFAGQYAFAAGRFGEGVDTVPYVDNDYWGVRGEMNVNTGIGNITAITAYRESKLSSLDVGNGIPAQTEQDDNQVSVEVRLAGPDTGLLQYLLGAYYYKESINTDYFFNVQSTYSFQDINLGTKSFAGFGRLTLAPTDKLRFVGGARFTKETKRFNGRNDVGLMICTVPGINQCANAPFYPTPDRPFLSLMIDKMGLVDASGGAQALFVLPGTPGVIYPNFITLLDRKRTRNKVTWRAGVEFDVADRSLLYASVESGFHAGGFSFSDFIPEFGPESIMAYTVGSKNRFLDNRLQVNLELFYWVFKDQQLSHFADDGAGHLSFVTENAGKSTNKGAELSLLFKPVRRTQLSADIQYLKAKYDDFLYLLPSGPTAPRPITGCPFVPAPGVANQVLVDCSGKTALKSPKWTINLGGEQSVPIGHGLELVGNVDFKYQSRSVIGFEMVPGINEEKGYTTTSVALTLKPETSGWAVTAFVRSIENNRPVGQTFFNNQFNVWGASPLPPRTYGLNARIDF